MPPKTKKIDILQRRIPQNPKYKNIQSTIDTGASLSRYQRKVEELRQNYRFRNDELFKRMKIGTFVQLILQVEEINLHAQLEFEEEERLKASGYYKRTNSSDEDDDNAYSGDSDGESTVRELKEPEYNTNNTNSARVDTERSTLQSVISGMGEIDVNRSAIHQTTSLPIAKPFPDNLPYLLLDVRDRDEYDQFHIIKALNYPHTMLSRSVNFETKEMLACRNQAGKIVVVYDEDERIAPKVATVLFQRGYDNLFMLSGGLKVAMQKFPRGLICGNVPKHLLPSSNGSATTTSGAQSRTSTARSKLSNVANASGDAPIPDASSVVRDEFTSDDIEELAFQLDRVMNDGTSSTVSSRLQSRSSARTVNSTASVKSSSSDMKKPFK